MHRRHALKYLGLAAGVSLTRIAGADAEGDRGRGEIAGPGHLDDGGRLGGPTFIPFMLYGRRGRAAVTYEATADPVAAGFDVLPKLRFDPVLCRGYPSMRAVIDRYDGEGYRTICGWIQVVTGKRYEPGDPSAGPSETSIEVDKFPSMGDVDIPFASVGNVPQMFDAPCHNLNGKAELQWTADTFLTTVPVRSRDEEIQRLLGFRWGYNEYADPTRQPVSLHPLEVTGPEAWANVVPVLRKEFPNWRFGQGTAG